MASNTIDQAISVYVKASTTVFDEIGTRFYYVEAERDEAILILFILLYLILMNLLLLTPIIRGKPEYRSTPMTLTDIMHWRYRTK